MLTSFSSDCGAYDLNYSMRTVKISGIEYSQCRLVVACACKEAIVREDEEKMKQYNISSQLSIDESNGHTADD